MAGNPFAHEQARLPPQPPQPRALLHKFSSLGLTPSALYDLFDRPTLVTYPDATFQQLHYQKLDLTKSRDRQGRWSELKYNNVRQLISSKDPLGRLTQLNWCTCGSLTSLIDPAGQTTVWEYDVQSRLIAKEYADGKKIKYRYENTTSRLKNVTDAKGQVTNYQYFTDNALKQVSYTNATVATPTVDYTYEAYYPRLATMVDVTGTTTYAYKPIPQTTPGLGAGRLLSIDGPLADDTIAYTYDELGRTLGRTINGSANASSVVYDVLGRVASVTNPLGTFGYTYVGATGRVDHVDYPNGQRTNYAYYPNVGSTAGNSDQRLQSIANLAPGGANLSTFTYTYSAEGMIKTWSRQLDNNPALTSTFDYDAADQLTSVSLPSSTSVVKDYAYRYSPAGNRLSEQIGTAVTSATYNNLNQLTSTSPTGPIRFAGTVNEPSNVTVNGQPASVTTTNQFTADVTLTPGTHTVPVVATDGTGNAATKNYQVTVPTGTARTLTYDANGNLLNNGAGQTYDWDAADRLVKITQASGVTEFVYDGIGQRVHEKLNGNLIKQWLWAGGPQPAEERDANNIIAKRFFGGTGQQIDTASYFFTNDHLGSVREMTDSTSVIRARYEYDSYGRMTKISGDLESDLGFTGFFQHRASALSLTLFRPFDPLLGRWLSRDPSSETSGVNLYSYVENNPLNFVDEFGLKGHHVIPGELYRSLPDSVAKRIFRAFTIDDVTSAHAWGKPHKEYNEAVKAMWKDFIRENGIKHTRNITERQAFKFIGKVMLSNSKEIAGFLKSIVPKNAIKGVSILGLLATAASACEESDELLNAFVAYSHANDSVSRDAAAHRIASAANSIQPTVGHVSTYIYIHSLLSY